MSRDLKGICTVEIAQAIGQEMVQNSLIAKIGDEKVQIWGANISFGHDGTVGRYLTASPIGDPHYFEGNARASSEVQTLVSQKVRWE